ncbi:MAG: galE [Mucilaginibacter sp.]|nr:galE [Mucilaginibacter sp.]
MKTDSKTILVTGGTGYIGSHTVVELQSQGYKVIIIDNLSNSKPFIVDQITKISGVAPSFHNIDLNNADMVKDFVDDRPEISGVIHFAAFKSVGESVHSPLKYYRNNLNSLIHLLSAFSERKTNLVFSSSCTVYGQPDQLPVTEKAAIKKAESPYGNTKQIAEEILQEVIDARKNCKAISLRYFNPVGAHESALIGELPLGVPQNLVPYFTQSAIGKRGAITIYGDNYEIFDGTCIRDYIHVVDLAKAHVEAIKLLESQTSKNYDVFNIGTGKGTSVLEMINAFQKATGVTLKYTVGSKRSGDITQVWADITKSKNTLNWKAELDLHHMMYSAWQWEQYIHQNPLLQTL